METSLSVERRVHDRLNSREDETYQDIVTPPEWIPENCLWAVVLIKILNINDNILENNQS